MSAGRNKHSRSGTRKQQRKRAKMRWHVHRAEVLGSRRAKRRRFK